MIPKMRASHFTKKYSVSFVQPDGRASEPFYSTPATTRTPSPRPGRCLRSEFDVMLRDNAIEKAPKFARKRR